MRWRALNMFSPCVDTTGNINVECENVFFCISLQYVFLHHAKIPRSRESSARERTTKAQLQWEGVWISFVSFYNSPGKADNCLAVMSLLSILPMTIVGKPVLCARQEKQHFPPNQPRWPSLCILFSACMCFLCFICLWEVSMLVCHSVSWNDTCAQTWDVDDGFHVPCSMFSFTKHH